jgi:DHA1 family tetracycline resistance protein-like MFS transporter
LIAAGIAIVALGFAGLALASGELVLAGSIILVGVGQGLIAPSLSGLLSRITPASEQGAVFGTLSSAQTLARMISYSTANLLLGRVSNAAPYWFGCGVYLAAGLAVTRFLPRLSTYLKPQLRPASVEPVPAGRRVE